MCIIEKITFYSLRWMTGKERRQNHSRQLPSLTFIFLLWLYSPLGPWSPHIKRFLELFRHMVIILGRVISPSQGLYLHRTTQHRKTRANIHALSGIWTHDPSNQPANRLRPHGHCDRLNVYLLAFKTTSLRPNRPKQTDLLFFSGK
jgi:hypothetical protein